MEEVESLDIVSRLLTMYNQYKVYHWQTKSYAQHMAFDRTLDGLKDPIDSFVEVYFGKYGRLFAQEEFEVDVVNINKVDPLTFTNEQIDYLTTTLPTYLHEEDTDLLNIRDEMLAVLNTLKYLLTLN